MSVNELLTEKDFLAREFPAPANHYRPLAVIAPTPGEDPAAVAGMVRMLAGRGYGGLVLDPRHFGTEFLGEGWFGMVGHYLEAARLTGLALWVLDGFTLDAALASLLDEAIPAWRGWERRSFTVRLLGPDRLSLALTDPEAKVLGAVARPIGQETLPTDLRPYLTGGVLEWTAPEGEWEIICFRAVRRRGTAAESFAWTDEKVVTAWLEMAFNPYREFFGPHFGRNFQGFFVFCPPAPKKSQSLPLYRRDPSWEEMFAAFTDGPSFRPEEAEAIYRSYLLPLREWCWRHRLRLAGYRLGGEILPALLAGLDIGGLPDLDPTAPPPDPEELAGLAGLARGLRQERVAVFLPLTGDLLRDRAELTGLAAAGADLFLVRPPEDLSPGWEEAFNDYAARLAMATLAGGPAAERNLFFSSPAALKEAGRQALALAAKGVEAAFSFEEHTTGIPGNEMSRAEEEGKVPTGWPAFLRLRTRLVDDWRVYIFFNPTLDPWRGVVNLPRPGRVEIWHPTTGERRPASLLTSEDETRLPLTIEPGEAILIVIRRFGAPGPPRRPSLLRARLRLPRGWEFIPVGGNIKPLSWEKTGANCFTTKIILLTTPSEVRLSPRPEDGRIVRINGVPVEEEELAPYLHPGENRLELCGGDTPPRMELVGRFACRGEALAAPPPVVAGPWTQNGFPYFPGPGIYRQEVEIPAELIRPGLTVWLEVGGLAESAVVRINGEKKGFLIWPPYRLYLGPATGLRPDMNLVELEVHAPAGRPQWAFRGLLGEVSLLFVEEG